MRTNCAAKLEIHNCIPDEHGAFAHTHTYQIEKNSDFVREEWVYNNYSADPYNEKGEALDRESTDKKTRLGGLARPTLK